MGRAFALFLVGSLVFAVGLMLPAARHAAEGSEGAVPVFGSRTAYLAEGAALTIRSVSGGNVWWALRSGPLKDAGRDVVSVPVTADRAYTERLVSIPTSVAWKHPLPGLPSAMVLRAAEMRPDGMLGPSAMFTALFTRHELPVVSLLVEDGAFFDPDTGIYVVGHAALRPSPEMEAMHRQDGRWWKYPGNFHFRGGEWERAGAMQLIGNDGEQLFSAKVRIRVNGQMTRGFPQHALRLYFDEPIGTGFFPDGDGLGTRSLVLRTSGNDQMYALLRDGLAQHICADGPFLTAASMPCVVYVNGAYWGIHQLQQRIDEREIARRFGVPRKQVALLQMENGRFAGHKEAAAFEQAVGSIGAMDPTDEDFPRTAEALIDMEGFLRYMAAVMVLDNSDWPENNVRVWRYIGGDRSEGPLDGRWRFILNDMDLGLGANTAPDAPIDLRLRSNGMIARLFRHCMRSPVLEAAFRHAVDDFLQERLLSGRAEDLLEGIVGSMEGEMPRHVARWRRPSSVQAWHKEVEKVARYLRERPRYIMQQHRDDRSN
jgi:hypothetical protein